MTLKGSSSTFDELAALPVNSIKEELINTVKTMPVILTAPTGSGKSTAVPVWMKDFGTVLVIEPRRIAAKSLALRVSELLKSNAGEVAGFAVKEESKFNKDTSILFVTPGVAIRMFIEHNGFNYDTVILDEFHERTMETDLLAALINHGFSGKKIITSATIEAQKVSEYFNGRHIEAIGKIYPVNISYLTGTDNEDDIMPSTVNLESKVLKALKQTKDFAGDVLIFLPGKADIFNVKEALQRGTSYKNIHILHGELSLTEQVEIFKSHIDKKIILATNVAETSLTIPGVGVVIDSGLVKRTRFVGDRGFLTTLPIALDSANQRAGRAGRTFSGNTIRLWSPKALLAPVTPPEILRDSITDLLLICAVIGKQIEELDFYDPPKQYAVSSGIKRLRQLNAIDKQNKITKWGKSLFKLPLNIDESAFILKCKEEDVLKEGIDLISVISVKGELFLRESPLDKEDNLRGAGCDATAFINALRFGEPNLHLINKGTLHRARSRRKELYREFGLTIDSTDSLPFKKKKELNRALLNSDKNCAYIVRRRKKEIVLSSGKKEITLSKNSAVNLNKSEAIVVFSSMAMGLGLRDKDASIIATCSSPVSIKELVEAKTGIVELMDPRVENGRVICTAKRFLGPEVIEQEDQIPKGTYAISAIKDLFLNEKIFKTTGIEAKKRFNYAIILKDLIKYRINDNDLYENQWENIEPDINSWIENRLLTLGVDSGEDLPLLSPADLTPPDFESQTWAYLKSRFPFIIDLKDIKYSVEYFIGKREVVLTKISGTRKDPPQKDLFPSFSGFKIKIKHNSRAFILK
ncbi:MAG: ATP-dependent RNA helicase [Deltaproteobacteria bacterium]|nr:ATP-dependent RNA helicase [Deltaproteobacteria bacterium]